jgi:hypothetical protein
MPDHDVEIALDEPEEASPIPRAIQADASED